MLLCLSHSHLPFPYFSATLFPFFSATLFLPQLLPPVIYSFTHTLLLPSAFFMYDTLVIYNCNTWVSQYCKLSMNACSVKKVSELHVSWSAQTAYLFCLPDSNTFFLLLTLSLTIRLIHSFLLICQKQSIPCRIGSKVSDSFSTNGSHVSKVTALSSHLYSSV